MNALTRRLISKDLYLQRGLIGIAIVAGLACAIAGATSHSDWSPQAIQAMPGRDGYRRGGAPRAGTAIMSSPGSDADGRA